MTTYRRNPLGDNLKVLWNSIVHNRKFNRGAAWGAMIVGALFAFEIFNFSTTQYALHDMLGDLKFAGMRWSTVLAIARKRTMMRMDSPGSKVPPGAAPSRLFQLMVPAPSWFAGGAREAERKSKGMVL